MFTQKCFVEFICRFVCLSFLSTLVETHSTQNACDYIFANFKAPKYLNGETFTEVNAFLLLKTWILA